MPNPEIKLPSPDEKGKIVSSSIEFSPSQKTILESHGIRYVNHPINIERLCQLLISHGDSLESANTGKNILRYERITEELNKLSAEEVANLINNYDLVNPKMDLIWIKAAYRLLKAKNYIQSQ